MGVFNRGWILIRGKSGEPVVDIRDGVALFRKVVGDRGKRLFVAAYPGSAMQENNRRMNFVVGWDIDVHDLRRVGTISYVCVGDDLCLREGGNETRGQKKQAQEQFGMHGKTLLTQYLICKLYKILRLDPLVRETLTGT